MPYVTLGLDLGVASIGWALISEDADHNRFNLLDWGSRIFEQGLESDGLEAISRGKGTSRCAERREKKALRRQYRRRRKRKDDVKRVLTENGMLPDPLTPGFFAEMDRKLALTFSESERERAFHIAPYLYRKLALERPLTKEEFGRAIYHLAQRRGYLSNRKQELKEKDKDTGVVKESIRGLRHDMDQAGARTLAKYFCTLDPNKKRIRKQYTDRAMFQEEFHMICEAQRAIVSPDLEKELFDAIFFQNKLKSCKGLIGKCEIHPEHRRASMACEEAQLFRILTTVANLRVGNKKENTERNLTEAEYDAAVAFLNGFSEDIQKGTVSLAGLGKRLGLAKGEKFTLGDESKDIYCNELHAALVRVFGPEQAAAMPSAEQEKFFHDLKSIEKDSVLEKRLREYWKLSPLQVESAMSVMLPDSHCAYSIQALEEMLPDLKARIPLATVKKNLYPAQAGDSFDLLPPFDSGECGIDLRNPLVHRVMTELRTVVNAIVKRYGKPNAIHVELARDLKTTTKQKEIITRQNLQKEKERKEIAERILKEVGMEKPSRNDILKVMLADECNFECPYTGRHFSMYDLLYGKDIHIEHIIPYSRSFDDSFRNKTLCDASANSAKNNRTPFEAFSGSEEYQRILERVAKFKGPYADYKLDLFKRDKIDEEDFMSRNLNDTRYASRIAMQYLGLLYGGMVDKNGKRRIFATSGGATALIRRGWGGNNLLGEGEKVRTDHRHHAIDAVTIALTTPRMVQMLASMPPEQRRKLHEANTPLIDSDLYTEAKQAMESAAVSHHVVNKLRGALHEETIYGKDFGGSERHVRVSLASIEPGDIAKIVDPAIRMIVLKKLGKAKPEDVTKNDLKIFCDDENLPVLRDSKGNPVNIIKKVRVARNLKTITIGSGDGVRNVKTGSNYVLPIFAKLNENGEEVEWVGEIVTLLDAIQRVKHGQPVFEKERPGFKFKFSLKKGDIVKWTKDGKESLCIMRGCWLSNDVPRLILVPVNEARDQKGLKAEKLWFTPTLPSAFRGKLQKYRMNIFGELQRAGD